MNNETIYATGRLFELIQIPKKDGRVFEVARRAPGVRLIIANKQDRTVLFTKEHRWELNGWDYRLPGGKVFDTLAEFTSHRQSGGSIQTIAKRKAREEAAEEAGIDVQALTFFKKSSLGATVEWDLYIFEATKWRSHPHGQNLKEDEQRGIEVIMYPFAEAEKMIMRGDMQEERVALCLLQWLRLQ